jgi:hypothetical protein
MLPEKNKKQKANSTTSVLVSPTELQVLLEELWLGSQVIVMRN